MSTFLYPPRPEKAIPPSMLGFYERRGWIAQKKMNGTCSEAIVSSRVLGPTPKVEYWNRHHERHKAWTPTEEANRFFAQFPGSTFVFELLHSKGGGVRDTIYLFDVLRFDDEDLVGTSYSERLKILEEMRMNFTRGREVGSNFSNVRYAHTWESNGSGMYFKGLYDTLDDPLEEGLVLKNPKALLEPCNSASANTGWQVKSRKLTKNFGF